ncbi:MAG: hypothetical protein ABIT76_04860 [Chthoniobacterales bacterium]
MLQKKISKLSFFDGTSLVLMGALSLLCAAIWRDATGALVGVALVTLGGIELRGRWFLHQQQTRATGWLVGSQLGLLLVILSYCLRSLAHPPTLPMNDLPENLLLQLQSLPRFEGDAAGALQPLMKVAYALLMLVSVFYQGGMAMFYLRKTPLALQSPPPVPVTSQP